MNQEQLRALLEAVRAGGWKSSALNRMHTATSRSGIYAKVDHHRLRQGMRMIAGKDAPNRCGKSLGLIGQIPTS